MPEKNYKVVNIKLSTASGKTVVAKGLAIDPFVVHNKVHEDTLTKSWTFSVTKTKIDVLHIAFPRKNQAIKYAEKLAALPNCDWTRNSLVAVVAASRSTKKQASENVAKIRKIMEDAREEAYH